MTSAVLVRGKWVVTRWSDGVKVLNDGAVFVERGVVQASAKYEELRRKYPDCLTIGDGTHLVVPGFVNAHSHGRGLRPIARGLSDGFLEVGSLRRASLGLELSGDPYWDTLLACARHLEGGITTTLHVDPYYAGSREQYERRVRRVLAAYEESGIRFGFALGIRDQNNFAYVDDIEFIESLPAEVRLELEQWPRPALSLQDYLSLYDSLSQEFRHVELQFGPVNPVWCSESLLIDLAKEASRRGIRMHMHLLETVYQKAYALSRYGRTAVAKLADIGVLGPNVTCAHCVWVTEGDIAVLKDADVVVVHNPSSNLRLRSGVAPVIFMASSGLRIALGIDSLGLNDDEDMLQEIRLAQVLQSPPGIESPAVTPETVLTWATEGGTRALGMRGVGKLEAGSPADLLMIRVDSSLSMLDDHMLGAMLVQSIRQASIEKVLVAGRVVVENGRYILRDREEIAGNAFRALSRRPPAPVFDLLRARVSELYSQWHKPARPFYVLNEID